jgi:hypothetical protein
MIFYFQAEADPGDVDKGSNFQAEVVSNDNL